MEESENAAIHNKIFIDGSIRNRMLCYLLLYVQELFGAGLDHHKKHYVHDIVRFRSNIVKTNPGYISCI